MEKGEINVYGTGLKAMQFILNNSEANISCCIEGKKNNIKTFMHLPVLNVSDAENELQDKYTVVACNEETYLEIKKKLEKDFGLTEFENFEYCETYKKKIAIIYGNCHTLPIKEILKTSSEFSKEFGFYPIPLIQSINESNIDLVNSEAFKRCKLFLHGCIRKNNKYGEELSSSNILKKIGAECKVIGFPNLYNLPKVLFPQVDYSKDIKLESFSMYHISDKYIESNMNSDTAINITEITIENYDLLSKIYIQDELKKFYKKLEIREKDWDIKISDFIKENLTKEKLFYDPYHPTNLVFLFIANEILKMIGINELVQRDGIEYLHALDHDEMPIYSCVRRALNLQYDDTILRKYSKNSLESKPITIIEYVNEYERWNSFG